MDVWIVDSDKKNTRALIKILGFLDQSISITKVVANIHAVDASLSTVTTPPKLILVNQEMVAEAEATTLNHPKFILPFKDQVFVYLAYCIENLCDAMPSFQTLLTATSNSNQEGQLKRTSETITDTSANNTKPKKSRFMVMHGQKFLSIPTENIAYFFSDDRFVFFMTYDKQKFLVEYRMEELQQLLDPKLFFRINRSYIVSINSLESIHPYFGSRFKLKLNPPTKKEVIVSRERTGSFRNWLGE